MLLPIFLQQRAKHALKLVCQVRSAGAFLLRVELLCLQSVLGAQTHVPTVSKSTDYKETAAPQNTTASTEAQL